MSDNVTDKQLTSVYKKNGSFDKQRKMLLENFKESETHTNLLLKLKLMVENKIKIDPSILMKNRGKMGALIQGEIIYQHLGPKESDGKNDKTKVKNNNSLLNIVDKDIQEKIIDSPEFHDSLKVELKDIKRRIEGINDEDYAKILEEERIAKEQEMEKHKLKNQEKELAYKNNFKVKHLNPSHKVMKAPRFNFGSTSKSVREHGNGNGQSSDRQPYLMY